MKQIQKNRLLKLADFLENTVPRKHFDLTYITHDKDTYDPKDDSKEVIENENKVLLVKLNEIKKDFKSHNCNTVACAVGWLPAVFPRTFMWNKNADVILRYAENEKCPLTDFDAVEEFLGLQDSDIGKLFIIDYYPKDRRGPKSVAKKIRAFVKTGNLSGKQYHVDNYYL